MVHLSDRLRYMCAHSRIEPSMYKRNCRQNIQSVLFCDVPMNFWSVRCCISKSAEEFFDKVHQTRMFASFTIACQRIECEPRPSGLAEAQGLVYQWRAIGSQASHLPQFLCNALR